MGFGECSSYLRAGGNLVRTSSFFFFTDPALFLGESWPGSDFSKIHTLEQVCVLAGGDEGVEQIDKPASHVCNFRSPAYSSVGVSLLQG